MNPLHTVLLTVGLFALSFLSPGPNLLVVVQASLQGGRVAGLMTGLGVAAGDACYAALGRFGMAPLITAGGSLFAWVQMAGGAYLVWYAFQLVRRRQPVVLDAPAGVSLTGRMRAFRRGMLTDLFNPQTVLFFASIFSMTLQPDTPHWAKAAAWAGLVATSVVWRLLITQLFSMAPVRRGYARMQRGLELVVGAGLGLFGLRLISEAWSRR